MQMPSLILLVLPIFLVIILGKTLQLTIVKDGDVWAGINKISYWVLFPAFLFTQTSKLDLSDPDIIRYSTSLIVAYFAAMIFAYCVGKLAKQSNPTLTSVIQGAGRHNTFIGLAVAGQLFGIGGTATGTVATAALVPLSNVVAVVMMGVMLNKEAGKRKLLLDVVRNPIILAIVAGLAFSRFNIAQEFVLYQFTGLIGKATLPTLLLVIGANLRFAGFKSQVQPIVVSTIAKMFVFPIVAFCVCQFFALSPETTVIAVIFATCPTSPAGFPLAKQMGGDAPVMATIISFQTAFSVIAIPTAIALAQGML